MADDGILELYRREITPDLYAEIRISYIISCSEQAAPAAYHPL